MIRATISEVKNGLSAHLRRVRSGESVLILDRGTPIARIVPVGRALEHATHADVDADADARIEARRVFRRPFHLSHAAKAVYFPWRCALLRPRSGG